LSPAFRKAVRWWKTFLCLLAVLPGLASPAASAADARDSGPLALVITYHVPPANRAAFRNAMEETEAPQFQRWKAEGVLQSARLLVNRYVDAVTWDAMAILTFARYADVERWKRIEQATPAGLSAHALRLTSAIETAPGDLVRESGGESDARSTFLVIPYEVIVPASEYVAYVDGYVVPQMDGWKEEGVLARYGVFLARYPAGRPWQSMLILEYKDDAALGARDATTAKVRARLADNPRWKAISDAKKNQRNEKAPAIADAIRAR
jgi:hypothetical protein